ncbi:olfactory receptor 51G2-like [Emydura macquarii macquarii]|uniref:olfactory receptor 51G2-like n=1 Tax=Emydura macquarii macquarii TaxID=1129001 RepID=UPI00352AFA52
MYSLVILLFIIVLDQTLIGLSYGLIIRAVLRISSKKANRKALNMCTMHIFVMLMSCTPFLFSTLTHRFGQGIAAHVHILSANLYLLVPPMISPIIYGVKTQQLHDKFRDCHDNVLSHSYCLNQEVMKMSCSDTRVHSIYSFFGTLASLGLDDLLILLSYVMILKTVLSNTSHCVSHIYVVLIFHTPETGLSVIHRFMKRSSPLVQPVMSNSYLLVPP